MLCELNNASDISAPGDTQGKEGAVQGKEGAVQGKEGAVQGKEGDMQGKEGAVHFTVEEWPQVHSRSHQA